MNNFMSPFNVYDFKWKIIFGLVTAVRRNRDRQLVFLYNRLKNKKIYSISRIFAEC